MPVSAAVGFMPPVINEKKIYLQAGVSIDRAAGVYNTPLPVSAAVGFMPPVTNEKKIYLQA